MEGDALIGAVQTKELPTRGSPVGYADRTLVGESGNRLGKSPINEISAGFETTGICSGAK
jgi:hypothetical protein